MTSTLISSSAVHIIIIIIIMSASSSYALLTYKIIVFYCRMKHIFYDCIWRNEDLGFFCVVVCKNPSWWEWLHCPILRRLFEAWRVGERFLFALWWSRTEIFGLLWSRIWTRCSLDISYFLDPLTKKLVSVSKQVICARCSSQREYPKLVLIPPDSGSDEKHPQSLHSLASYLQLQHGWSDWLQRLHQGKV